MDRTFWITKPLVVLFDTFIYSESLRFLSLHDNKYLRYYKGHQLTMTGLLHVQGRPATTYDDQGPVFAVAFGGYIRMFDAHVSDSDAVKFSNDGRLMLPTSMEGHIRVLDSFQGTLFLTIPHWRHLSARNIAIRRKAFSIKLVPTEFFAINSISLLH
ncbi:protein ANTHESIS POMOTING FACTOR 1-like isoform X4 [Citrus clementina]|uniref:protein ANTHESIS POMOTING FACTOR 1-like isoform X4 n=1 Tax=Citrus clementina TaxID=85681 RepID=UPI000CECF8E8|nr:protein ANTHESIS POMOTING FACTOR 1-like isoform X4 [Citrus x clementina]